MYFVYVSIPFLAPTKPFANRAVGIIQPLCIFLMLFLTFCKVEVSDLKPCKWHWWLLLIQGGVFVAFGVILHFLPESPAGVLIEGAMIAMICPTATAAAVVTRKLNGSTAHVVSYTILINILVSVLIPAIVPMIHPHSSLNFITSFLLILGKVFPLLICPFIVAIIVRHFLPRLHKKILEYPDAAFYVWSFSLALAIAVTTRSIVHSDVSVWYQLGLALISAITCAIQFFVGKKIGKKYGDIISAGQSLGQKNTVFAIWLGYSFFTPVCAVVGGFYSICHNVVNSYQLYKQRKMEKADRIQ